MHTRCRALQKTESKSCYADVFIIAPVNDPEFPHQYNPIYEELKTSEDICNDYRLLCMILNEEVPNKLREVFLDSLNDLQFRLRSDDSYVNLPRFKKYLAELSHLIVAPYFAPSIQVERELGTLGFAAKSETVL